tara:strand:+ start:1771 stop:3438 length:1668 start_codon:yes stop_codon:yes gene_type:complete
LLFSLNASKTLRSKIASDIQFDKTIHSNEIINALKISKALVEGSLNVALVAPMQSGKTGTIKYLCNIVLTELGFLQNRETVFFTTSMRDTALYDQNSQTLEVYGGNILVNKIDRLKKVGLADINYYNTSMLVRDEDQYGCGQDSTFDFTFFKQIRNSYPEMPIVMVSATPYDIMDAENHGLDVTVVKGERSKSYFGITEMLEQNLVKDLPKKYQHIISNANGGSTISDEIKESIMFLKNSEKGLGIIRCNKTEEAVYLKNQLKSLSKNEEIETFIIGSRNECDYSIVDGLKTLPHMVERLGKKVILIVMQALSAGKDLKSLKEHVRFVIEIKKRQLANIVQGLPGRICGYHSNRNIKVFGCKEVMQHFSEFENNPYVIKDEKWINKLYYDQKLVALSTQTQLQNQVRTGQFREVLEIKEYTINDLFDSSIEQELSFLSKKSINKIISFFHEDFYNKNTRQSYIVDINTNVYASTYSSYKTNTFVKNWKTKVNDNMKKVFTKIKDDCYHGILIANYPVGHPMNKIGFTGIKVYKCGEKTLLKRRSSTINFSMYERL